MEQYILSLDQGTTSSRAILFDKKGKTCGSSQLEFTQHYPKPGWVEHDPVEIWETQKRAMQEAIIDGGVDCSQISAIGITNQRETVVVWDRKTGDPVCPAIVWQDRRTAGMCSELTEAGHLETFIQKTGLRLDPYFSGTKLKWILDHNPGLRKRAKKGKVLFGTIDTWLLWKLTGGTLHITDASNASRTLLFNLMTGDWDHQLLEILDIPEAMLPEIHDSSEVYGTVDPDIFPGNIPIAGIAGDQQAALFGQSCFKPGMIKNTYGTGCFILMNTGQDIVQSTNNLLTTVAWRIGDKTTYALEGSVFIGGAVIQWLRDELGLIKSAPECDELAATVVDSKGVYIVPAFAGLGAPHWDPFARGSIFGLTRGSNKAHICRAALESIAFQSAEVITCMERDYGGKLMEMRVDGGASCSAPLLQFQSNLIQSSVVRPACPETTALGAAYLAGLAVGYWKDMDEIADSWRIHERINPDRPESEMHDLKMGWETAVERSKNWAS